jgi:hypothetical protein
MLSANQYAHENQPCGQGWHDPKRAFSCHRHLIVFKHFMRDARKRHPYNVYSNPRVEAAPKQVVHFEVLRHIRVLCVTQ